MQPVAQTTASLLPERQNCIYTSHYCEENVWKLCEHVNRTSPSAMKNIYAVFISNHSKKIPLWCQKAGEDDEGFIVWDYHVILVHWAENGYSDVYDIDTKLPFPCPFRIYIQCALKNEDKLKLEYRRMFRVVPGDVYLQNFASDRKHMWNNVTGQWLQQPPRYPCICTSETINNLQEFISMDAAVGVGEVMSINQIVHKFT